MPRPPRNSKRVRAAPGRVPSTIAALNHNTMDCIVKLLDSHERRCLSLALRSGKEETEHLVIPELLDWTLPCADVCMCLRRKSSAAAAYGEYQGRAIMHGHAACLDHWSRKAGGWSRAALTAAYRTGDLALARRIRAEHPKWDLRFEDAAAAMESGNAECITDVLSKEGGWGGYETPLWRRVVVHNRADLCGLFPPPVSPAVLTGRCNYAFTQGMFACVLEGYATNLSGHDAFLYATNLSGYDAFLAFARGGGRLGLVPVDHVAQIKSRNVVFDVCASSSMEDARWLIQQGLVGATTETMLDAINYSATSLIRVLHEEHGVPIPPQFGFPSTASRECIAYVHERTGTWPAGYLQRAVASGKCDAVAYALEHGAPRNGDLVRLATSNLSVLWMLLVRYQMQPTDGTGDYAAQRCRVDSIRMLLEHGLPVSPTLIATMIDCLPLDTAAPVIRMAHRFGHPLPDDAIPRAARRLTCVRGRCIIEQSTAVLTELHRLGCKYVYDEVLASAEKAGARRAAAYIRKHMAPRGDA